MTNYSDIYEVFLQKITDYNLSSLITTSPLVADYRFQGWLKTSIVKFQRCKTNLNDRNDTTKVFNNTLSSYEIEILAALMVVEWVTPEVNNLLNIRQILGDTDFKIGSQHLMLKALIDLKNNCIYDADYLKTQYTYDTSDPYAKKTNNISDLG